jgi:hypothetical protein
MLALPVASRVADMDLHSPRAIATRPEVAVPGLSESKRNAESLNGRRVCAFILHIHDAHLDVDDRLRFKARYTG